VERRVKVEVRFILSEYVERAMEHASYDKLEDGTFSGVVPQCQGVIAFSETLRGCEAELQSVLEDWILTGIKLGHSLPIIDGIDLNREPTVGAAESL
jgi:predicted RNase H-like HicB family nuclease